MLGLDNVNLFNISIKYDDYYYRCYIFFMYLLQVYSIYSAQRLVNFIKHKETQHKKMHFACA